TQKKRKYNEYNATKIKKRNENKSQRKKNQKESDNFTHSVFEELNRTFITPLDREDISRIASKTDDIIDYIEGISGRIVNFKIKSSPPYMLDLAKEIHNSTKEINLMITSLNTLKVNTSIIEHCRTIREIAHRADDLYRKDVGE